MSQLQSETTPPGDDISLTSMRLVLQTGPQQETQVAQSSSQPERNALPLSRARLTTILFALILSNFIASFTTGLITTGLPVIAADLALPDSLLLWPSSVFALTGGSLLLLAGSVGDIIGSRVVFLTGVLFNGGFVLACALARTGIELILFRALQGIAAALCSTNSVSILTSHVPSGKSRNIAFSCLGLAQPLGFSVGLVLGGVFADTIGWRAGWYMSSIGFLVLFGVCIFAIPTQHWLGARSVLHRLRKEVDWIGAMIASTCLALFSYVLAQITSDLANIHKAVNIAILSGSIALIPAFGFWIGRKERRNEPALIPNSLWKSRAFTSTCFMVLSSYAIEEAMELFCSLYFQNIQGNSTLQSSLRLLPMCIMGAMLNLTTGVFVHRFPAVYLVLISSVLSAGSPLLMALLNPRWPYWYAEFPSQILQPLSVDVLFTVGILVVSDIFPENTQALAGGVFNTFAQLGVSIGLAVMGVVSRSATKSSAGVNTDGRHALLVGYRASFWTAFAWMIVACCVGALGLRKMGKVGLKRD